MKFNANGIIFALLKLVYIFENQHFKLSNTP